MKLIRQFDSSDCGAACLCMIAGHFNAHFSLAKVRDSAGTDIRGTNLSGMLQAAEKMGFSAKAMKGTPESFKTGLPVPFIARVKKEGDFFHYVVVEKVQPKQVKFLDPSSGRKGLSIEDFLEIWTGYAVFLNPTPNFEYKKKENGLLRSYFPLFRPHVKLMLQIVLSALLLTLLGILGSFYFRFIVDEVIPSKAEIALHVLSIGVIILTLFTTLLGAVRNQMLLHFTLKTGLSLNLTYIRHILRLPLRFFESRKVGDILARFTDSEKIRGILSHAAMSVFIDVFMVIFAGVFLFFTSTTLFWISVITIPLSTGILWIFARFFRELYRKQMVQEADNQSFLVEALNGIQTIKGLNASSHAFNEIEKKTTVANSTGYKTSVLANFQHITVGLIDGWSSNVLFWVGAYLILKDQLTLGQLMTFNALLSYFMGPLKRLLDLQPSIQEAIVAADRLSEILQIDKEEASDRKLVIPDSLRGFFKVQDITFRYGSRRPVLEGVSFEILPGSRVGIVGSSGCGKSSLIKLLMKFYTVEKGEIFLDDINLKDIDTHFLRSKIGYVPQEIFLFSGSVRENISLHCPESSLLEIIEAAKRAQAHDFISDLPDRYETILAERGVSLSGGERQRIALARALLGNPQLLVFDEATSNLDSISERKFETTMQRLGQEGLTSIIIAHRLSTVITCDQILVMDKGRIVETGTHFELIKKAGYYSKLWEFQRG